MGRRGGCFADEFNGFTRLWPLPINVIKLIYAIMFANCGSINFGGLAGKLIVRQCGYIFDEYKGILHCDNVDKSATYLNLEKGWGTVACC